MPNNQKGFISVFFLLTEVMLLGFFLFSSNGPFRNTILSNFFPTISSHVSAQNTVPRPNIVVIMADDLDYISLDTALKNNIMPNLRSNIVSRGTNFARFFVTNSVCCPSRTTFLTGQYSHNHKVKIDLLNMLASPEQFNDSSTLALWLKSSGYRTGHIGKYLNGYGYADINKDGVRDAKDYQYVPPGWDDWQGLLDPSTYWMYNYHINDNGKIVTYGSAAEDYQTDVLSKRALDFISESETINEDAPFFLVVTPLAPHVEVLPTTPFNVYTDIWRWDIRPAPRHIGSVNLPLPKRANFNEADVSDKPLEFQQERPLMTDSDIAAMQKQYQNRLASLRAVDDLVASVSAKLKEKGEYENTVLIFTSDNGFMHGEHRLAEKLYPYEESIWVPLFVAGPNIPANKVVGKIVLNNDLAPTIAEMAKITPGHMVDGTSFVPLLTNPNLSWRKRFLIEHWRDTDHILQVADYAAVRTSIESKIAPAHLYVEYQDAQNSKEHYDLVKDSSQMNSIHNATSSAVIQQRAMLANWLIKLKGCSGLSCRDMEFGN